MRRRARIISLILLALGLPAAGQSVSDGLPSAFGPSSSSPAETIEIDGVSVTGRRPLAAIGVQATRIDTLVTRDNITNSLADVLTQGSAIFIKTYGRATLSTASFRGTAPSHTQVTWNGMKLNSPMLGMVDFSLIPSYFIDEVTLFHGASSSGIAAGGIGGAITLENRAAAERGFQMGYTQGIGSFHTFDQLLRLCYGGGRWRGATRAFYATSRNDFPYTNYAKIGHPVQRNANGSFSDLHVQQELYYTTGRGDEFSLAAWWMLSDRGVPKLDTDYRPVNLSRANQHEQTFRAVAGWERTRADYKMHARAGYTLTDLRYRSIGAEGQTMINSVSLANTAFGTFGAQYYIGSKWLFTGEATLYGNFVESFNTANLDPEKPLGYDRARAELSVFASVRWRPTERLGFAANIREELYGGRFSPVIPTLFAEYTLSKKGNVVLKVSGSRHFRYPTLNDLYFQPGGNPSLRPESGFTYDGGVQFGIKSRRWDIGGEVTGYDSYIDDWILWKPVSGYWTPTNITLVHSYGVEAKGASRVDLGRRWWLGLNANYTLSKAINRDKPMGAGDRSTGKQLIYIPEHSASVAARLGWRGWVLSWKYVAYSRRYTASDNDTSSSIGSVDPYHMNDLSIEKAISLRWAGVNLKFAVNNLFGEEYRTVVGHPMAGRNYSFFVEITPKFTKRQ